MGAQQAKSIHLLAAWITHVQTKTSNAIMTTKLTEYSTSPMSTNCRLLKVCLTKAIMLITSTDSRLWLLCDPLILVIHQVQNCKMTPAEDVFSDGELLKIIHKAEEVQRKPITAGSLPSFVTLHKVFLFSCILYLFHTVGVCATIANNQLLDDNQISLNDLKGVQRWPDCLRRSRNCPFCQNLNRKILL